MIHSSFFPRYAALTVCFAFFIRGTCAAETIQLADAGTAPASFTTLANVRAGLPHAPLRTSASAAAPAARAMAPSGHFLPLDRLQAMPMTLQHTISVPDNGAALHKTDARPAGDEEADDEDGDEGSAMKLFGGTEHNVSSSKFREAVKELNAPVKQAWPLPVSAEQRFSSSFGMRRDPFTGAPEFHEGIDLAAKAGTPVLASADGTVETVERGKGFGKYVIVRHHDGSESLYGHMRKQLVHEGQAVHQGQKIGEVGSTGRSTAAHLHYQLVRGGRPVNPMLALRAPLETGIRVASVR